MKIKKILVILTLLASVLVSMFSAYALLIDLEEKKPINFEMGYLDFSLSGKLKQGLIYPGVNLVEEPYIITNNSTIDTEIRIYLVILVDELEFTGYESFSINTSFTKNSETNYYYYNEVLKKDVKTINFIDEIVLDGKIVNKDYSGKIYSFKMRLEAKQKEHATWTVIGEKIIK